MNRSGPTIVTSATSASTRTVATSENRATAQPQLVPKSGHKQSGPGREWGTEGLEEFLETKTIALPAR